MAEDIKEFETWEECISVFLLERKNKKIVDLLSKKETKRKENSEQQAILIQLKYALEQDEFIDNTEVKRIFDKKNSGKNKVEPIVFYQEKYKQLIQLSSSESIRSIDICYKQKLSKINCDYEVKNWLNANAPKASGLSISTHVAKLTHSSARGSSFFSLADDQEKTLLITAKLESPSVDYSGNPALNPISDFLKLEVKGKIIKDYIYNKDPAPFLWITPEEQIINDWLIGFYAVYKPSNIASHSLLKQVYFPIDKNKQSYHLLCNVKSSSLAHALYKKITVKKNIKTDNYSNDTIKNYPNIAQLAITSSTDAHKNVSPLHVERRGKLYLLSSQPPTWQAQLKAPINQKTFFSKGFSIKAMKADIDYLRDFLLRFERIELSIKDPKREKWINDWVNSIIDEFLFQVSTFYQLTAGWSDIEKITLEPEYQYLLDPYRSGTVFQIARKNNDWQRTVCQDFADWLNNKLIGEDKQFTPQRMHTRMWFDFLKNRLREFNQNIELGSLEGEEV